MKEIEQQTELKAKQQLNSFFKKQWVRILLVVVLIGFFAILYLAEPNKKPLMEVIKKPLTEVVIKSKNDWPKVLKDLSEEAGNNMQVEKGFYTEVAGIKGWVVTDSARANSHAIVYTAQSDTIAIIGGLVDTAGKNLTNSHFAKFVGEEKTANTSNEQETKPVSNNSGGLNKELTKQLYEKTPTIKIGTGKEDLVIVVDMNCPYCKHYYNQIKADQQLLEKYTFRFLPVGILSESSVEKAAAFNKSTDLKLFEHILEGQSVEIDKSEITASMQRTMQWQQAGLMAVPLTIFNPGKENEHSEAGMLDLNKLR